MYKFDPELYGYEKIENFPELINFLPRDSFVKVIAIAGPEFDRPVYWFSYCSQNGRLSRDDKWEIRSSSYDDGSKDISESGNHRHYTGTIDSEVFSKLLLINIFGSNKNFPNYGLERLKQNINAIRLARN